MLGGKLAVVLLVVGISVAAVGCVGGAEYEEGNADLMRQQGTEGEACFIYDPDSNLYVMGTTNASGSCQIGCMSCPTWGTTHDCLIDPFCEEDEAVLSQDPPPQQWVSKNARR